MSNRHLLERIERLERGIDCMKTRCRQDNVELKRNQTILNDYIDCELRQLRTIIGEPCFIDSPGIAEPALQRLVPINDLLRDLLDHLDLECLGRAIT